MNLRSLFLGTALCILSTSSQAFADEPVQAELSAQVPDDDVQHRFSVTISPLHLALSFIEVTGEWRASDRVGIAGIVGLGAVDAEGGPENVFVGELGGQLRYYALGSFIHGMQLGTELAYVHASVNDGEVDAMANGLLVAPFVGYKIATNSGFTFETQVGPQFYALHAQGSDGSRASDRDVGVLLNLNLGWSF